MSSSIGVGDTLPDFVVTDHRGQTLRSADLRGKWLVLFFYPKDNTPACTAQACSMRDQYEDFLRLNATVIGVSADSDQSHEGFASKHRLPFPIVSDKGGHLRKLLGVPKQWFVLPGRVTYVVDPTGVVRGMFTAWINVQQHIKNAMQTIADGQPNAQPK
ncbi:MAG: peroxiredoxin [Phycisphaerales bacterium]|nr:peroxiredoxin [Phycisphaerales bacterium]